MKSKKQLKRFLINIGDVVVYKRKNWQGIVASISNRNGGILVDLSDDSGIKFRIIHYSNLEIIHE